MRNRRQTKQKKAISISTSGMTINYKECVPNNGADTISFVCSFNVLYQLEWFHNDKRDMAELVQTMGPGECARKNCRNSFFLPVMEISKRCRMWNRGKGIN